MMYSSACMVAVEDHLEKGCHPNYGAIPNDSAGVQALADVRKLDKYLSWTIFNVILVMLLSLYSYYSLSTMIKTIQAQMVHGFVIVKNQSI